MKRKFILLIVIITTIFLSFLAYISNIFNNQIYLPYSEFKLNNIYYYKIVIKSRDEVKKFNYNILYKEMNNHNINNNFYRYIDRVIIFGKDKNITYLRLIDGDSNIYFVDKNREVVKIYDKRGLFNPYKLFDPINKYHKHIISPICEVAKDVKYKVINNKNIDYIEIKCSAIIDEVNYNSKLNKVLNKKLSWQYRLSSKYGLISYFLKDSNKSIKIELSNIKG